ncbi:hypothetical protein E3P81_01662 [Wallemia ichthyophaga]|nr:hypothetical protein E3P97_01663 [Wallemia ichthyophaga]TIB33426.1 hypothetical protein E3P85_01315 [Wallemia ichthyophaga]TIB47450.1 hypothetical protein E3P82_01661 [Wallemia ichthyophaga]TIB51830.1 hypothetical protein E3P81_01662 [Wallemia ichthyophaga]TIB54580.1 hypothetical protein E3P80_01662 [Wallemia ichthyophaga]
MTNKKKTKEGKDCEPVQYQTTLKRGQACLSRLKLRCSADKPTTARECKYDSKEAREIIKIIKAQQNGCESSLWRNRHTKSYIANEAKISRNKDPPQNKNPPVHNIFPHTANNNHLYPMMYATHPSSSSSYSEYGQQYLTHATPSVAQMDDPYVVKREEATLYDTNLAYLHQPQNSSLSGSWLVHDVLASPAYDEHYNNVYYNTP